MVLCKRCVLTWFGIDKIFYAYNFLVHSEYPYCGPCSDIISPIVLG